MATVELRMACDEVHIDACMYGDLLTTRANRAHPFAAQSIFTMKSALT